MIPSLLLAALLAAPASAFPASSTSQRAAPSVTPSPPPADSSPRGIIVPDARAARLDARLWWEFSKQTKDIHCAWIRAADLMKIIDDTDLVLIDVRQPNEQEVSMLAHALTPREFAEKFRHGIPAGKRIVVYCTIGYRSGKYAEELAKQGIKAENLEGGVLAWSHAGGDFFVKDAGGRPIRTYRVHVYDKGWNFLHPDYQAVW